jgi:hypothetical protein
LSHFERCVSQNTANREVTLSNSCRYLLIPVYPILQCVLLCQT